MKIYLVRGFMISIIGMALIINVFSDVLNFVQSLMLSAGLGLLIGGNLYPISKYMKEKD